MLKCKKRKLSFNGSKQDMVERILNQKKEIKENNQTLIKLNGLSASQATQYFICGYIHITSSFTFYPMDIISMISQYIQLLLVRFDLTPKKYIKVIQKGGTIIKRGEICCYQQDFFHQERPPRPWLILYAKQLSMAFTTNFD